MMVGDAMQEIFRIQHYTSLPFKRKAVCVMLEWPKREKYSGSFRRLQKMG